MDFRSGIGIPGVVLAVLIASAMCVLSLIFHPVEIQTVQYGLCLPSPDSWDINPILSWIINFIILGAMTLLLWVINKNYNFVRTTEPALIVIFLIMVASNPFFTQAINTSMLLGLANLICISIVFDSYSSRNATQQMFILGLVSGLGSMFQYAFLPMAFIYFIWALFMKVMRIKETLALLIGVGCPYWIGLGSGLLRWSQFHFPSLNSLFVFGKDHSDFIFLIAGIAFAIGLGFILTLINSMKLYAGNSKVNAMNLCISALGAGSAICVFLDFDNMLAYIITLYMTCAVQIANICALWNPKMPWLVSVIPSIFYIMIFAGCIVF